MMETLDRLTPVVPASSIFFEAQLEASGLLPHLEHLGIVPNVEQPNPYDPDTDLAQSEQWWGLHPEERARFAHNFRTQQARMLQLFVGATLAATVPDIPLGIEDELVGLDEKKKVGDRGTSQSAEMRQAVMELVRRLQEDFTPEFQGGIAEVFFQTDLLVKLDEIGVVPLVNDASDLSDRELHSEQHREWNTGLNTVFIGMVLGRAIPELSPSSS